MAKIVIFFQSPVFFNNAYQSLCFYDGLSQALMENGHDVMPICTSNFLYAPFAGDNLGFRPKVEANIYAAIESFAPDLIIAFNNSKLKDIENRVSCPILVWGVDDVEYFSDIEGLKKNRDRYKFTSYTGHLTTRMQDFLDIPEQDIARIKIATAVKNMPKEKKYNVSFIGSPFFVGTAVVNFFKEYPEYLNCSTDDLSEKNKKLCKDLKSHHLNLSQVKYHSSGEKRLALYFALKDLGMKMFGASEWLALSYYTTSVIRDFDAAKVFSLKHNQLVYNRSKISINTAHAQNKTGYAWRVPDILASDAVLLSEPSEELISDFGKDVNLQIFHNPYEANSIAKKLINDDVLRKEIILQQNEVIESSFRWKHRFPLIEELTGVDLSRASEKEGESVNLKIEFTRVRPGLLGFVLTLKDLGLKFALRIRRSMRGALGGHLNARIKKAACLLRIKQEFNNRDTQTEYK